jgi:hypothetical protein
MMDDFMKQQLAQFKQQQEITKQQISSLILPEYLWAMQQFKYL